MRQSAQAMLSDLPNVTIHDVPTNDCWIRDFGPTFVRRVDAVSYTHLRAHETVLDLVCRLLLEKKKEHVHDIILYIH